VVRSACAGSRNCSVRLPCVCSRVHLLMCTRSHAQVLPALRCV
jgi:hypothetical protein